MRSVVRAVAAAGWAFAALAAQAATIASVSPQGEVAQVRQVTVKFSEAVVAFGDLRLPDPLAVSCQGAVPAGAGRWANDRVWLYDFREPLPPGTRCALKARAEWKPVNGALTGSTDYSFNTGGPAVVATQPYDGGQIAEDQYFLLRLNGAAVESTVLANAWCEVEGLGERIGVVVIGGDARAALLKSRGVEKKEQIERALILACKRPLPHAAAMRLVWGKGIGAQANPKVTTTIEQRFRFTVRPAFTAEFSCERENANAPCLPIRPMALRFSAPVAREVAAKVRLAPATGAALAPVFDKDDKATEVSELKFPVPLPETATFSIELPAGLKDNADRPLANASMFPLKVATGDAPPIAKFAAAPFGIVELADPLLPVTLRHVQGDLRPAAQGGQVRVKSLKTDAEILDWYAKLARYDERQISARDAGLPERDWFTFENDTDSALDKRGRPIKRQVERYLATRELSLLNKDASARRLDLPQLAGGDPRPFEVVGIPIGEPGYHVVEIESARLGQSLLDKRAPMFVRTGVLVTNLGVHFKLGRENSLVWVTTLDRGKPVEGAEIAVNDCTGRKLWSGKTDANGLAKVAQAIDSNFEGCPSDAGLFVTARKVDAKGVVDTAFVFSSWQKGIESWRFNVPTGRGAEPDVRASTVFDRTLFRAGETVSMKHFARFENSNGLVNLKPEDLPTRMKIVHQGTGQEFVQPLKWNGTRSAAASWSIPPAAKLGVYSVSLERESPNDKRR
ncbi:MAG: alpha-2-macroglobulin, partial [Rhizobiales bacterium]|nr:alpha-2-macroglobulin [Rhizobacter sp.]